MPSPPARIGRYEVRDRLGEGGMGVVYLATDPRLQRTVAIKILSVGDATSDELRERFAREARSVAALKHNHIVTIYDIGEDQNRPFIAMEFLDGETLAEMIRRRAQLTLPRKLQLIGELCAGLGYAHRNGIVHRDVKPANLMITAEGTLKILDFGLARVTAELTSTGLTRHGALMGTPFYMSPEQIDGTPVDHRSDIFAVGLVLYEMLTYRKAFPGDSSHVVLHDIIHKQPTAIRNLLPSIDPELEEVVHKGLEKDRSKRYQNLAVLGSDLERIRARLRDLPDEPLPGVRSAPDAETSPGRLEGSGGRTPRSTPSGIPNLGAIAERRAAQIDAHLSAASRHLATGQFEAVIEQCEHALVLNPQEPRALEMLSAAHRGLEDARVDGWLADARGELSRDALTGAESLVEQSLKLRPDHPDALKLRQQIRDRRREKERIAERERALRMAVQRARGNLDAGALDAALRSVSEALAYDPAHEEASALRDEIQAAIDARRREQEHEQAAQDAVAEARRLVLLEDFDEALARLRAFDPPHPTVDEAIPAIEAERAAYRRRQEEEERRRLAEEERRRAEEQQRLRDEEERQRAVEEERVRQETARLAQEQETARLRQVQEERRRQEEEERRQRQAAAVHCGTARVALEQGRVGEAAAMVERARALAPDDAEVRELSDAVDNARRAAAAADYRRHEIARLLHEARERLQGGEIMAALRLVDSALDLDPRHEGALALQAQAKEQLDARARTPRPDVGAGYDQTVPEPDGEASLVRPGDEEAGAGDAEIERTDFAPEGATEFEPVRRQIRTRALYVIAAAAVAIVLGVLAAMNFLGPRTPGGSDPDQAARATVETAEKLYASGQVNDAIALLERARPTHALITQKLSEWTAAQSAADRDARAKDAVADARKSFDAGQRVEALERLAAFQPAHPIVAEAIAHLRNQVDDLARAAIADARARQAKGQVKEAIGQLEAFRPEHAEVAAAIAAMRGEVATVEFDRRVKAAQDFQRRGQDRSALGEAQAGLQQKPDHPALRSVVRAVLDGAARRTDQTRQQAAKVPGAAARAEFAAGVADDRAAAAARETNPDQALTFYESATRRFDEARSRQELDNAAAVTKNTADALRMWVGGRQSDLAEALRLRRWDEAERIEAEIRAKAPQTPGLDDARSRIANGRKADAAAAAKIATVPPGGIVSPPGGAGNPVVPPPPPGRGAAGGDPPAANPGGGANPAAGNAAAEAAAAGLIFKTIERFSAAMDARRVDDLRAAWPKMSSGSRREMQDLFNRHHRVDWNVQSLDVKDVRFSGDGAELDVRVRTSLTEIRSNRPIEALEVWRFKMARAGNEWVVEDARRISSEPVR
jgi:serine/threonine protein kinase